MRARGTVCERLVDLVNLPARKGLAMLSSVDSVILLQTAPGSTSAAALGLPGPSILPPSAKLAAAGIAASTRINFITIIRSNRGGCTGEIERIILTVAGSLRSRHAYGVLLP